MPADEVVVGLNEFTEQPVKREYTKGVGWRAFHEWQGPQALLESKASDIKINLDPSDLKTVNGVPAVITYTTQESGISSWLQDISPIDDTVWELLPYELEKDIRTHGKFRGDYTNMEKVDDMIRGSKDGVAGAYDFDTTYSKTYLNDYRDLKLQGVDSYFLHTYIVRGSITVADSALVELFTGPATVGTPGDVVGWGDIGIGSNHLTNAKFAKPSVRWCNPANGNFSLQPLNEWLVRPATVRYSAGTKKYVISMDWLGAVKWSQNLYYNGTGDP